MATYVETRSRERRSRLDFEDLLVYCGLLASLAFDVGLRVELKLGLL